MTVAQSNYPPVDQTAPDGYQEVVCPGCSRLTVQISNQAILILFGQGPAGAVIYETAPEPYLPVVGEIVRPFDAFKFKAYTPGAQLPAGATAAQVKLIPRQ